MDKKKISWPGWEVVRRIGGGSFGTVYEIQRDIYGNIEKSALKVISIPINDDETDYLRYSGLDDRSIAQVFHQQVGSVAKEYILMAQLRDNPNIVRCDDFRDTPHEDGLGWDIYIKMELLTPIIKCPDQVASEEQIIRMAMDICNALIDCQKKNIIHRDIKPHNVFISESGRFKLGDFGIARTMERTTHATAGIGTYSYMAPEIAKDEPYGQSVDIYSLGLMMYWLLNERRGPFMPLPPIVPRYGDEEQARKRRFAGEMILPPKNGSEGLKAVVLRACSFKPEERFSSASEMYGALQALTEKNTVNPTESNIRSVEEAFAEDEATVGMGWRGNQGRNSNSEQLPTKTGDTEIDTLSLIEHTDKAISRSCVDTADSIICPVCSLEQKSDRKVCWQCGHVFESAVSKRNLLQDSVPVAKQLPEEGEEATIGPVFRKIHTSNNTSNTIDNESEIGDNIICPACNYEQRSDRKVCWQCGQRLDTSLEDRSREADKQNLSLMQAGHRLFGIRLADGFWKCACGRVNAAYVSSCACGIEKRKLTLVVEHTADTPTKSVTETIATPLADTKAFWHCSCGRENAAYVSSCACGRRKRDIENNNV